MVVQAVQSHLGRLLPLDIPMMTMVLLLHARLLR